MAGASPVINLVNNLIQRAIRDKASDIHIEITRGRSRVRFRVDGVLYEVMTPRVELHPAIVSRLKVMANLDIAERRLPQDGRIQVATQGRTVDLRFSSLPGINGEKVVLRVLDKNQSILDVEKLGMSRAQPRSVQGAARPRPRPDPGHRADRQRQDDDALCGGQLPEEHGDEHRHHRGPGRVPARHHQPEPGQRRDRPDLREACSSTCCGRTRTS